MLVTRFDGCAWAASCAAAELLEMLQLWGLPATEDECLSWLQAALHDEQRVKLKLPLPDKHSLAGAAGVHDGSTQPAELTCPLPPDLGVDSDLEFRLPPSGGLRLLQGNEAHHACLTLAGNLMQQLREQAQHVAQREATIRHLEGEVAGLRAGLEDKEAELRMWRVKGDMAGTNVPSLAKRQRTASHPLGDAADAAAAATHCVLPLGQPEEHGAGVDAGRPRASDALLLRSAPSAAIAGGIVAGASSGVLPGSPPGGTVTLRDAGSAEKTRSPAAGTTATRSSQDGDAREGGGPAASSGAVGLVVRHQASRSAVRGRGRR